MSVNPRKLTAMAVVKTVAVVEPLTVVEPVTTVAQARDELSTVLRRFRAGDTTPVVLGSHRKPEAVITGHGKLAVWSARHFPRTVRFIQRQAVQRMPGNLLAGPTRKKP